MSACLQVRRLKRRLHPLPLPPPPPATLFSQDFTNTPPLQEVQAPIPAPGTARFTFSTPGVYWFACPVPGALPRLVLVLKGFVWVCHLLSIIKMLMQT